MVELSILFYECMIVDITMLDSYNDTRREKEYVEAG